MAPLQSTHAASGRIRALLGSRQVAFLIVGVINLVIGLSLFAALHLLFGDQLSYMLSLLLAYAGAIVCAFMLHRRFVFRVRGRVWVDLSRFTMVQMASFGVNAAALPLLVEVVGLAVIPAQVIATAIVVVFNYFGHLLFSFRRSHTHHTEVGS